MESLVQQFKRLLAEHWRIEPADLTTKEVDQIRSFLRETTWGEIALEMGDEEAPAVLKEAFKEYRQELREAAQAHRISTEQVPPETRVEVAKQGGSLQSLAIYAGLQPVLIESRREVLHDHPTGKGGVPLDAEEIPKWLVQQFNKHEPDFLVIQVEMQLLVRRDAYFTSLAEEWQSLLNEPRALVEAMTTEQDTALREDNGNWSPTPAKFTPLNFEGLKLFSSEVTGTNEPDTQPAEGETDSNEKLPSRGIIGLSRGRLLRLFQLTQEVRAAYPNLSLVGAVELILGGRPPHADHVAWGTVSEHIFPVKGFDDLLARELARSEAESGTRSIGSTDSFYRHAFPTLAITIDDPHVSQEQVAALYRLACSELSLGGKRRPFKIEAEILGIAALEVLWGIDGPIEPSVVPLDQPTPSIPSPSSAAFYQQTRRHFRNVAGRYPVDVKHYKSWKSVRKTIRRLETSYMDWLEETGKPRSPLFERR